MPGIVFFKVLLLTYRHIHEYFHFHIVTIKTVLRMLIVRVSTAFLSVGGMCVKDGIRNYVSRERRNVTVNTFKLVPFVI